MWNALSVISKKEHVQTLMANYIYISISMLKSTEAKLRLKRADN